MLRLGLGDSSFCPCSERLDGFVFNDQRRACDI